MANEDEGFNWGDTIVFWDIQGYPTTDCLEACDVLEIVEKDLREMGNYSRVSLWAYGDAEHREKYGYENFYYILTSGEEDDRRRRVLVDICCSIVSRREQPLNLVLILGDISGNMDLVKAIRLLRSKGHCKVFLVQPPSGSGQLGSTDWLRAGLSAGEMLFTQIQTPNVITRTWMSSRLIEQ